MVIFPGISRILIVHEVWVGFLMMTPVFEIRILTMIVGVDIMGCEISKRMVSEIYYTFIIM